MYRFPKGQFEDRWLERIAAYYGFPRFWVPPLCRRIGKITSLGYLSLAPKASSLQQLPLAATIPTWDSATSVYGRNDRDQVGHVEDTVELSRGNNISSLHVLDQLPSSCRLWVASNSRSLSAGSSLAGSCHKS